MSHLIAPSILAADFANLQRDIEMINSSQADWIHVDIMDGVFVPNISLGLPVCEAINRHAKKPLDVHLMIQHPENYIEAFVNVGASNISVHYESTSHLNRLIHQIKAFGITAGVALNPHTPVNLLEDIIKEVDLVLLMSVNPGFGAQKFIENTFKKISDLTNLIAKSNAKALIQIDGGVNQSNASDLIKSGVNVLVAGNFIFNSPDPLKTILDLKKLSQKRLVTV